jgi:diguanylate cyclase (GGDEF)-like protein
MLTANSPALRVIVVEDDEGDAVLVERALAASEFQPLQVGNRQSAIDSLAAGGFAACLLDLSLPDSFGLEGVEVVRASFPDLPIVVVTGLSDSQLALQALERGAQDYLVKGEWTSELLIRTLHYAIQRQQAQAENRRLLGELARQARHDGLTGLLNRCSLIEELTRHWSRSTRTTESLSCVMVDVDFFKRINDVYGHAAGDCALQAIAAVLRAGCRAEDTCGRYGGEEFCVILPGATQQQALAWAERMRRRLGELAIPLGAETLQITASFGVAERTMEVARLESLIDRADQALRLAKQLGRDRALPYCPRTGLDAGLASGSADADIGDTAGDLLCPLEAVLDPTATLEEAARYLIGTRSESLSVVDSQGNLLGTVGEQELTAGVTTALDWKRSVAEIMKRKPPTFGSWVAVETIREFLVRTGASHVLIVEGRRPIGVVTRLGILRWLTWRGAYCPAADADRNLTSTDPVSPHAAASVSAAELMSHAELPAEVNCPA